MTERPLWRSAVLAAVLATATACAPSATAPPTASAKPSSTPSGSATGAPSAPPSGSPMPAPSGATPAPSSLPSTPDTSSRATIQGVVFDANGVRLDGVTVTGQVLGSGTFANGSDVLTVTTQAGSYALNGAPTGATILVTASKAGLSARRQTIVPLSNLQGDTTLNRVSFGETVNGQPDPVYALTAGPEVIAFTPASATDTAVSPTSSFTLSFSGPVNTADVEAAFAIYVAGPFAVAGAVGPADAYTLSALGDDGNPIKLPFAYDSGRDSDVTDKVTPNAVQRFLYDRSAFTTVWSSDKRTVAFTFKPGYQLPTDKDATRKIRYAVSFQGKVIRDADGVGRSTGLVRTTPAQVNRAGFTFQVAADTSAPAITVVTGLNQGDTTGGTSDRIRVQFSKPMHLFPANFGGKTIPGLAAPTSAAAAGNLKYTVKDVLTGAESDPDLLAPSGSQAAVSLAEDASHSTIEFAPSNDDPTAGSNKIGFTSGSTIWVRASTAITDPAGNPLDPAKTLKSGRGI